jgi:hypothetical protein
VVREIMIRARNNDTGSPAQTINAGQLQYSDDGKAWVTAFAFGSDMAWQIGEQRVFSANTPVVVGGGGSGGGASALSELSDVDALAPVDGDTLVWSAAQQKWVHTAPTVIAAPTESIIVALGDEITSLTTGLAKTTIRMPYGFVITAVRATVTTASTSGVITVDVNQNGTSIFSTPLTIDEGEKSSKSAVIGAVIATASLADDDEITFDVDTAGTGAAGLKVYLIGHQQ